MSQAFSLYTELTVMQNLELHARLFGVPEATAPARIAATAQRFDLLEVMDRRPATLPLGLRQRLSLAVAMVHAPDVLILDEPTSGVDPIARDAFWRILIELSRKDEVTIFVSTHFMNEAERCDRVSFMHAGKVLESDSPAALVARRGSADLEGAFIACLMDAEGASAPLPPAAHGGLEGIATPSGARRTPPFDIRRMLAYTRREALELRRDPIRATLALLGSLILMLVIGYGVNMDVEELAFAVLDRDDTTTSRDYVLELAGSRYFTERLPLADYDELDRRMREGELSLALEIPPGFARDVARGRAVSIGAWIDGAMPARAETVRGYVEGMHASWLAQQARTQAAGTAGAPAFELAIRYRYNPDVRSLDAMVPAVIPLLLMLIPAMLAVLSVVREKELGSMTNFYVTPVTRLEFLLGKQIPYVALAMLNFLLLAAFAVAVFRVPVKGDFATLACGALVYVVIATGMGLLISTFMKSQIAAIFGTSLIILIPATQYSGMIDPVSSLEGLGAFIGRIYPTTHFMTISRGTFSKALGFEELAGAFLPLLAAIPVLLLLAVVLLRKQAR